MRSSYAPTEEPPMVLAKVAVSLGSQRGGIWSWDRLLDFAVSPYWVMRPRVIAAQLQHAAEAP